MSSSNVLVIAASTRTGSLNRRLATMTARELRARGANVTHLDLIEYPLPIYCPGIEADEGVPAEALALHEHLRSHQGVFIASPEYNSAISPLLVNVLTWVSRVRDHGGHAAAFARPVFALGSASPGASGGYRGLVALRQMLELGLMARVLPTMATVPMAHEALAGAGALCAARSVQELVVKVSSELIAAAATPEAA